MDRETSVRARDATRSQDAPVEVRPCVVMTVDRYKEWSAAGEEGQRQIPSTFDQVVADLVEKYKIVDEGHARGLRDWLDVHIPFYFQFKLQLARRLTIEQDRECREKIKMTGDVLLQELLRLFNLVPADIHTKVVNGPFDQIPELRQDAKDYLELNNILLRAQRREPIGGQITTKRRNAAKTALKYLGHDIRCFWVGWSNWLEDSSTPPAPPVIAAGSGYVQFARYIYAFVSEYCEEDGVISRLKVVEEYYDGLATEIPHYHNSADFLTSFYGRPASKKQAKKNNA